MERDSATPSLKFDDVPSCSNHDLRPVTLLAVQRRFACCRFFYLCNRVCLFIIIHCMMCVAFILF